MSVQTLNRIWLACTLFVIVVSLLFLAFYKPDGDLYVAVSSSSVEEIEAAMNNTKHIKFVEDLGVTPEGKALFSYRWKNCGAFDVFAWTEEITELAVRLDISVVEK